MSTTSYTGSALDVKWLQGSGTNTISGNQTNFSYTPSVDLLDQSSGADTNKKYLMSLKDGQATIESLFQSGTNAGGTAMGAVWSPEGTAATKPKYTIPAFSQGAAFAYPFNEKTVLTCSFQQNGTRVEGTN
jgi:hypothetical protein